MQATIDKFETSTYNEFIKNIRVKKKINIF